MEASKASVEWRPQWEAQARLRAEGLAALHVCAPPGQAKCWFAVLLSPMERLGTGWMVASRSPLGLRWVAW